MPISAPPPQITLDLDATDDPLHGQQEGRFSTAITTPTAICRLRVLRPHLLAAKLPPANIDATPAASKRWRGLSPASASAGAGAHFAARRFGLCSRGADGLVREQWRRFPVWPGQEQPLVGEIEGELAKPPSRADGPKSRRGRFKISSGEPSTAGAANAGSSPKRSGPQAKPIRGLSSPRCAGGARGRHLYEKLYCPRRDGKPHQGMPARSLRRSHLAHTMRANQLRLWLASMAVCPDLRLAPHRPSSTPVRPRLVRDDPPQAPEDWGAGAHQCAPHQARHAVGLSLISEYRAAYCQADRYRDGLQRTRNAAK